MVGNQNAKGYKQSKIQCNASHIRMLNNTFGANGKGTPKSDISVLKHSIFYAQKHNLTLNKYLDQAINNYIDKIARSRSQKALLQYTKWLKGLKKSKALAIQYNLY